MIYDTLANLKAYQGLQPELYRALELLTQIDFATLPDGKYEVDGEKLFYQLSTYDSREENDTPEAHRKYIDVQFLVSGQEWVGVAPLSAMEQEVEARPEGDIWFYRGPVNDLLLAGDRFMVFFPQDAHAPCVAVDHPAPCRKCLVKVMVQP